jgi:hypothetical protein
LSNTVFYAEWLLQGKKDGRFLVRPREGKPEEYVLGVVFRGRPTHHLVAKGDNGKILINKRSYGDCYTIREVILALAKPSVPGWPAQLLEGVGKDGLGVPVDAEDGNESAADHQSAAPVAEKEVEQTVNQPDAAAEVAEAQAEAEAQAGAEAGAEAQAQAEAQVEAQAATVIVASTVEAKFVEPETARTTAVHAALIEQHTPASWANEDSDIVGISVEDRLGASTLDDIVMVRVNATLYCDQLSRRCV